MTDEDILTVKKERYIQKERELQELGHEILVLQRKVSKPSVPVWLGDEGEK